MQAAVTVVIIITFDVDIESPEDRLNAAITDIRYSTTPNTAATASATNKITTEKLKTVAGNFIRQKGGCGSSLLVIVFKRVLLTLANRAKYCGRGCSS